MPRIFYKTNQNTPVTGSKPSPLIISEKYSDLLSKKGRNIQKKEKYSGLLSEKRRKEERKALEKKSSLSDNIHTTKMTKIHKRGAGLGKVTLNLRYKLIFTVTW